MCWLKTVQTDLRYSLSLLMSWPWAGWASATILTSLLSWASTRTSPFLISSSTIRLKQGTSAHRERAFTLCVQLTLAWTVWIWGLFVWAGDGTRPEFGGADSLSRSPLPADCPFSAPPLKNNESKIVIWVSQPKHLSKAVEDSLLVPAAPLRVCSTEAGSLTDLEHLLLETLFHKEEQRLKITVYGLFPSPSSLAGFTPLHQCNMLLFWLFTHSGCSVLFQLRTFTCHVAISICNHSKLSQQQFLLNFVYNLLMILLRSGSSHVWGWVYRSVGGLELEDL